jgi:hypothetical protein
MALAGVCTALIAIVIGTPSPANMQPRMDASAVDMPLKETDAAQPAARPQAPRRNAVATATTGSPAAPASATAAVQGEAATIVGCLERDDETFRLKDVEGEDAPKSRSWKSGFLRRSNARVDVVDAGNRMRLASHVGHRVSVTGMLAEREIDARSLKMVADTCEE